jgi:hypothetical protein
LGQHKWDLRSSLASNIPGRILSLPFQPNGKILRIKVLINIYSEQQILLFTIGLFLKQYGQIEYIKVEHFFLPWWKLHLTSWI